MKNSIKIILLVTSLVIVVAGALVGYNILKENNNISYTEETSVQTKETLAKFSDFTFYDLEGKELKLSDFAGKPIVLNFWATWCPPCKEEMPLFESAYQEYGEEIEFIMLNLTDGEKDNEQSVNEFISENNYTFPTYLDKLADGAQTYSIYTIPQTFFINSKGYIIYSQTGAMRNDVFNTNIQKLLAKN